MFNFLRRKNNEMRNLECNCKRKEDQEIVTAFSKNKAEMLEKFLKINNYSFKVKVEKGMFYRCGYGRETLIEPYSEFWINNVFLCNIDKSLWISKKACISCGTCLGLKDSKGKEYENSLYEYFRTLVDNHLNEISEEKRKKELAKEICGIKEEY